MAPKKKEKEAEKVEEPVEEVVEEPPPPPEPTEDEVTELSTGLQLPLRGVDVGQVWALGEDWAAQQKFLVSALGLEEAFPSVSQRSLICDFYVFNLQQAKALCLSQLQGAVIHSIMHSLIMMMRCPDMEGKTGWRDMPCDAAQCFKKFQELLVQHSINSPPTQLGVFRLSDAKMLTDFASTTLFKHFLLYQFCINMNQEVQTLRFCRPLQRPLAAPDLTGARLKPRRKSVDEGSGQKGDGSKADEKAGGPAELDEVNAEDAEVERLVKEKLEETRAALQRKLDEREQAFQSKVEEKKAARPSSKGKKK